MVQLPYGYALTADEYQYIVGKPYERLDKRTGETRAVLKKATYHKTVAQALQSVYEREKRNLIQSTDMSLGEAVTAFAGLGTAFKTALEQLLKEGSIDDEAQDIRTSRAGGKA